MIKTFSRMEDYEVTLKGEPCKRGLEMIKQGTYFAIFPPYYRPDTRPLMEYSEPILEEKLMVFLNESTVKKREENK